MTSSRKCIRNLRAVAVLTEIHTIGKSSKLVYFSADLYCYSTSKHILVHLSNLDFIFLRYFLRLSLQLHQMYAQTGSHVSICLLIDWTITCLLLFKRRFFFSIFFSIRKNELVENNLVNFSDSKNFTL